MIRLQGISPGVRTLLILNVTVYIAQQAAGGFLLEHFALHPDQFIAEWKVWQLLTYQFLHGSFLHLFFNLFTLWMFGVEVENVLGSSYFIRYFLFCGIGGGVLQIVLNWGSSAAVIGASAAVYGVLVAFALIFPDRVVTLLLFFILPVHLKASTLAMLFVGISLFLGLQAKWFGSTDQIAHFAHLGGAVTGFLILKGKDSFQSFKRKLVGKIEQKREEQRRRRQQEINEVRQKVDQILDHINQVGYANISRAEKEFLKKAGEILSKEKD